MPVLVAERRQAAQVLALGDQRSDRRQRAAGPERAVGQAAVAKIEKRTDMYVSTLRRFIEAMGGELDIVARFPDREVHIRNFGDLN